MYLPARERISVLRRPTSLRHGESFGDGGFRTYVMSSSPTTAHMSFLSGIELGTVNNSNFWCTPENATTLVCCGRRSTGCTHFGLESKRQRMTISSERPPPLMYWHPCTTKKRCLRSTEETTPEPEIRTCSSQASKSSSAIKGMLLI
jgi:hypothetical protein